ncbi:MAG TPA: contractile injection system protein, VgrG/Pvc8 family [Polyangiaceae bacterium]
MADISLNLLLNDQRADSELMAQLVRAEIRESDIEPTVLALRFKMVQQPNGEFTPLDDDLFKPATALAVDVAAPGGLPERLFSGFVSHVRPHFETIESNCYIEVMGMDIAALLDVEDRVTPFPDSTDSEAVQQIFNQYRITARVSDTPARHLEDRQLMVQRESDWKFVKRLARRNGFVCYFEFDQSASEVAAYFGPPRVDDNPQPDLTIFRDNSNLTWFDVQHSLVGPVRHFCAAIDPIAKRLLRSTDEPISSLLGGEDVSAQTESGLTQRGVTAATAHLRDATPEDAAVRQAGSAATDRDRFRVEARGELDPLLYRGILRARRPVLVKGVGRQLAGVWYVQAVRTTLSESTLTQTFALIRNGLGPVGSEKFGQSAEEIPPQ